MLAYMSENPLEHAAGSSSSGGTGVSPDHLHPLADHVVQALTRIPRGSNRAFKPALRVEGLDLTSPTTLMMGMYLPCQSVSSSGFLSSSKLVQEAELSRSCR